MASGAVASETPASRSIRCATGFLAPAMTMDKLPVAVSSNFATLVIAIPLVFIACMRCLVAQTAGWDVSISSVGSTTRETERDRLLNAFGGTPAAAAPVASTFRKRRRFNLNSKGAIEVLDERRWQVV